MALSGGHDHADPDAEDDVGEEQQHRGEGGGAQRRVEADQPGRERGAPGDQQGDHQEAQDPQQSVQESGRQVGLESHRGRGVQEFGDGPDGGVAGGDAEGLAGEEGGAGQGEQPQHDQRDRAADEFAGPGHGPVVQGAQEEVAGHEGAGQAHREGDHRQAHLRPRQ